MSNKKKICCEYCFSPIGYVDMDKLAVPITPDMFSSILPDRGIPDPFHISLEWKDFKCPYCRLRPFKEEGWLSFIDNKNNIIRMWVSKIGVEKKEPEFVCDRCGKVYQKDTVYFKRHIEACNG